MSGWDGGGVCQTSSGLLSVGVSVDVCSISNAAIGYSHMVGTCLYPEILSRHGKVREKQHQSTNENPDPRTKFVSRTISSCESNFTLYHSRSPRLFMNLQTISMKTTIMNTATTTASRPRRIRSRTFGSIGTRMYYSI